MCRKFMPKVMVGQYEQQLRQLTTTLSDYRGKRKYPSSWPANLSAYEIVIEALVLLYKYRCLWMTSDLMQMVFYDLVAKQVL